VAGEPIWRRVYQTDGAGELRAPEHEIKLLKGWGGTSIRHSGAPPISALPYCVINAVQQGAQNRVARWIRVLVFFSCNFFLDERTATLAY
jgi:hypothetical protein